MAGDTLRGIGKKQLADALEAASQPETEPSEPAAPDRTTEPLGSLSTQQTLVDAQARPQRSLDDLPSDRTGHPVPGAGHPPPGAPLAGTTTVVMAPPVDDAVPLPATPTTPRSGPNRVSFGTMIGHEMHSVQARVVAAIADADAGTRGTAHGRDVHLAARPTMAAEPEVATAPARAVPETVIVEPEPAAPAPEALDEFSGGDHTFFDTAPINEEYEPENPRGPFYARLAVGGAVLAVVLVVVFAWAKSHGNPEEAPPPVEVKAAPAPTAAPAPVVAAPVRNREPPTTTIPPSIPETRPEPALRPAAPEPAPVARAAKTPAVVAAVPAREVKAPPVAPAAPREVKAPPAPAIAAAPAREPARPAAVAPPASAPAPAREVKAPAAPVRDKKPAAVAAAPAPRETQRPVPAAAPAPPARTTAAPVARLARPETAPARPATKPAVSASPKGQKAAPARGKQKYDPDGTLPLSFD